MRQPFRLPPLRPFQIITKRPFPLITLGHTEVFYLVRAVAREVGAGHSKVQLLELLRKEARERYERENETLEYWEKELEERKQEQGDYRNGDEIAAAERTVKAQREEVAFFKKAYDTANEGSFDDFFVFNEGVNASEYEVMLNFDRNGENLLRWDEEIPEETARVLGMILPRDFVETDAGFKNWVEEYFKRPLKHAEMALIHYFRWAEYNNEAVYKDLLGKIYWATATGGDVYKELCRKHGSKRGASEALLAVGIKGIEYRDSGSRNDGADITYNYVVFDEADVKVVRVKDHETGYEWQGYEDGSADFAISIPRERICRTKQEAKAMVGRGDKPVLLENKFLQLEAIFSGKSEDKFSHRDSLGSTFKALEDSGLSDNDIKAMHFTAYGNIKDLFANGERMKFERAYKKKDVRKGMLHVYSPFEVEGYERKGLEADIEIMLYQDKSQKPIAYLLSVSIQKKPQAFAPGKTSEEVPHLSPAADGIRADFPDIVKDVSGGFNVDYSLSEVRGRASELLRVARSKVVREYWCGVIGRLDSEGRAMEAMFSKPGNSRDMLRVKLAEARAALRVAVGSLPAEVRGKLGRYVGELDKWMGLMNMGLFEPGHTLREREMKAVAAELGISVGEMAFFIGRKMDEAVMSAYNRASEVINLYVRDGLYKETEQLIRDASAVIDEKTRKFKVSRLGAGATEFLRRVVKPAFYATGDKAMKKANELADMLGSVEARLAEWGEKGRVSGDMAGLMVESERLSRELAWWSKKNWLFCK